MNFILLDFNTASNFDPEYFQSDEYVVDENRRFPLSNQKLQQHEFEFENDNETKKNTNANSSSMTIYSVYDPPARGGKANVINYNYNNNTTIQSQPQPHPQNVRYFQTIQRY
jgi:hypothetical protein